MREPAGTAAEYDWPSERTLECPYPLYEALREEAPVYELPPGRFPVPHLAGRRTFLVSRWDDIVAVAQQPDRFEVTHDPFLHVSLDVDYPTIERYVPCPTAHTNGPEHRTKRAWSLRIAEPARLREWEPKIRAICRELIDAFVARGECEFRWDFAEKLPIFVICDMLGLPRADAGLFLEISDQKLKTYLEAALAREAAPQRRTSALHTYMQKALEERLRERTDDLLSELLYDQIERDGTVDMNFQVAQGINLILAGAETTAHLLTNMMLLLCRNAALMERVRADRTLISPFVEETMRLESPVQWLARICTQETIVGGTAIPEGAAVIVVWASGNRDPRKFDAPDEVRLDRPSIAKNQLGFGRGVHLCAGAALARLEAVVAFETLFARLERIHLVSERSDLSNIRSYHGRGPKKLAIAFAPAGG